MAWTPISELELWDKINAAEARMNPQLARLWEVIRVSPQKWSEKSYGGAGGGFWVVAIIGSSAIWYNDIEDGFNRSRFSTLGELGDYFCNQDELEETVQDVLNIIETGVDRAPRRGPPIPGSYRPNF